MDTYNWMGALGAMALLGGCQVVDLTPVEERIDQLQARVGALEDDSAAQQEALEALGAVDVTSLEARLSALEGHPSIAHLAEVGDDLVLAATKRLVVDDLLVNDSLESASVTTGAVAADSVVTGSLDADGVVTGSLDADSAVAGSIAAADLAVAGMVSATDVEASGTVSSGVAPACPPGYSDESDNPAYAFAAFDPGAVLCVSGSQDQMVRVGDFWIDRFEASVWDTPSCQTSPTADPYRPGNRSNSGDLYPSGEAPPTSSSQVVYACSVAGVLPSGASWYQAHAACAASGKTLPDYAEWVAAAQGTPDPNPATDGTGGTCLSTGWSDGYPYYGGRVTGDGSNCASLWGVEDAVGGIFEEWLLNGLEAATDGLGNLPGPEWTHDDYLQFVGHANESGGFGNPLGLLAGGKFENGIGVGVYALRAESRTTSNGFRCVRRR